MEALKNNYSMKLVTCMANHLQRHLPGFERETFEGPIRQRLEGLELKDRSQLIADNLHLALPEDFDDRARVLRAILHPDSTSTSSDEQGISGWGSLPLSTVVGQHGLDDFDQSLELLKIMTPLFSSEFAIRYFLLADQDRTLDTLKTWITDPDYRVRRLVTEGTRPRLPWAMQLPRLINDPSPILPFLTALRDDGQEYVRRSVANHLNDIAKDHPDRVAKIAGKWIKGATPDRKKLLRHACRSLIKQGHRATLSALGYAKPQVSLKKLEISTPFVQFGDAVCFNIALQTTSSKDQDLIIDYALHHRKANGKTSPKVFKWKTLTLRAGDSLQAERKHAIRQISTRAYYGGEHRVEILINGESMGMAAFELMMPAP